MSVVPPIPPPPARPQEQPLKTPRVIHHSTARFKRCMLEECTTRNSEASYTS